MLICFILGKFRISIVRKRKVPKKFIYGINRNRGYYWVCTDSREGFWQVGYWTGSNFNLMRTELDYHDYDFDKVNETQIKME